MTDGNILFIFKRLTNGDYLKTTIKEVAEAAQVSTATVSLALNNNNRISSDTQNKVLKIAKKLNYYPSRQARALVTKTTGNIGFILTQNHFLKTEPFYTKIFLGSTFQAQNQDYYVFLNVIDPDFSSEDQLPRFVLERNIDGIILAGKIPELFLNLLSKHKIPSVFIDYFPNEGKYPAVVIDNIQGGFLATEHLINLGHTDIAFVGGEIEHPSISNRLIGYKSALDKHNLAINDNLILVNHLETNKANGYLAGEKLFAKEENFSAVFCSNDTMALGLIDYLRENKQSMINELSIIGFDDIEGDILNSPSLSTIRVNKIELGVEAIKLLVNAIEDKEYTNKKIVFPVELIKRESTKIKINP